MDRFIYKGFIILLLLALVMCVLPKKSVYAAGCTSSTAWEHHYVGGLDDSTTAWGVKANIETQTMDICPFSGYSVWVTNVASGASGWAQMGYRKRDFYSKNQIYTEAQSDKTNYYTIKEWGAPYGTNTYNVDFFWTGSWNTSYWRFLLNGSTKWSIGYSELSWKPNGFQVLNELHDSGDQVAGTAVNPVSWGYVQVQESASGSYSSTVIPRYISSSISSKVGTNMASSDNAWETWDKRYLQ